VKERGSERERKRIIRESARERERERERDENDKKDERGIENAKASVLRYVAYK
jgi:hypothetical protein